MMKLKDEADLTISKKCQFSFVQGEDIFPSVEHLAGGRSIQSAQYMKKSGLSNTGYAHNRYPFTLVEGEIDSLEDVHFFGSISKGFVEL